LLILGRTEQRYEPKNRYASRKNTLRLAKQKAAKERRPLSDLIQEALEQYLSQGAASPKERKMAFHLFCERPMKIPQKQLRYLLAEDRWNV
jgi:hypothetical protein